ncbi:hypothetical protein QQF64_035498 [Cirrhinus molitorella]|uniref:Leptin n=2 Tax=Cirrhinus molitorella TaxID=172907 RepID=A0AA88PMS3_9TELE|nr:hypothetical protein Q8A67_012692 [Cirrhinus molitorella]
MVQTFITRIEKIMDEHFKFSREIDLGPRNYVPIDGLTSALDHLRMQLRPEVPQAQHLQQVQMDLKTLLTTLEKLAISQRCPLPDSQPPAYKDETTYSVTSNYLYLLELHWYLEELCLYMDKLKWCKDMDVAGLCC